MAAVAHRLRRPRRVALFCFGPREFFKSAVVGPENGVAAHSIMMASRRLLIAAEEGLSINQNHDHFVLEGRPGPEGANRRAMPPCHWPSQLECHPMPSGPRPRARPEDIITVFPRCRDIGKPSFVLSPI